MPNIFGRHDQIARTQTKNKNRLLLRCSSNNLFEWREDNRTQVRDTSALRSLKREAPARSVAAMTLDIPADKLEKLSEMLAELKDEALE